VTREEALQRQRQTLTPQQRRILSWIHCFRSEHNGRSPSVRDIQNAFGFRSANGPHAHLKALHKKGMLTRTQKTDRTLQASGWLLTTPEGRIIPMTESEATTLLTRIPVRNNHAETGTDAPGSAV
jgi:SOS-response transcriptional repressor LexA